MNVGVARLHGVHHGVDHRARLLGRGGIVEIDERLAIDLLRQDRELRPDGLDVVGLQGAFIAYLFPLPSCRACAGIRSVCTRRAPQSS